MSSSELFKLQREIALLIVEKLKHLEITPKRAAEIARFVLKALPESLTDEQIKQVIPTLDDQFFELAEVVHKHLLEYEAANRDKVTSDAQFLIKQGKIEEANKIMKDYFDHKLQ